MGLHRRSVLRLALGAALALGTGRGSAAAAPLVAAASSVQAAATELARAFKAATGTGVTLAFGASGNLARQIRQGAPFEMLLAADEGYIRDLARDGFTRDEGTVYATGRLALVVPCGGGLAADGSLDDLARALAEDRLGRFAIASPEHAPYGMRAAEALRHRGLWEAILPHLVYGENVAQAAQFAVSGATDGGLIALSLALEPAVAGGSEHALIPRDWHAPLRQRMVLTGHAGPAAAAFYDFLRGPRAGDVLRRHGLDPAPATG